MIIAYTYHTRAGTFTIRFQRGKWHVLFGGENLGNYTTPQQAAEELSSGGTDWPGVTNPSKLGISDDISDWEKSQEDRTQLIPPGAPRFRG